MSTNLDVSDEQLSARRYVGSGKSAFENASLEYVCDIFSSDAKSNVRNDLWFRITNGENEFGERSCTSMLAAIVDEAVRVIRIENPSLISAIDLMAPEERGFSIQGYKRFVKNRTVSRELKGQLLAYRVNLLNMGAQFCRDGRVTYITDVGREFTDVLVVGRVVIDHKTRASAPAIDFSKGKRVAFYCDTYTRPSSTLETYPRVDDLKIFDSKSNGTLILKNVAVLNASGCCINSEYYIGFISFNFRCETLQMHNNVVDILERMDETQDASGVPRPAFALREYVERCQQFQAGKSYSMVMKLFCDPRGLFLHHASHGLALSVSVLNRVLSRVYSPNGALNLSRSGSTGPANNTTPNACVRMMDDVLRADIDTCIALNNNNTNTRGWDDTLVFAILLYYHCNNIPSSMDGSIKETIPVYNQLRQTYLGRQVERKVTFIELSVKVRENVLRHMMELLSNFTIDEENEGERRYDFANMLKTLAIQAGVRTTKDMLLTLDYDDEHDDDVSEIQAADEEATDVVSSIQARSKQQEDTYQYLLSNKDLPISLRIMINVSYSSKKAREQFAKMFGLEMLLTNNHDVHLYVRRSAGGDVMYITGPGTKSFGDVIVDINLLSNRLTRTRKYKDVSRTILALMNGAQPDTRFILVGHSLMGSILAKIPYPDKLISRMMLITVNRAATLGDKTYPYELALRADHDVVSLLVNESTAYSVKGSSLMQKSAPDMARTLLKAHTENSLPEDLTL